MNSNIKITEAELLELYTFMEKANELFHQSMNYSNSNKVAEFGYENYPLIKKYYYDILWDKLPEKVKENILNE
jgi:hypothetical protein